jgi:hypothetical protein
MLGLATFLGMVGATMLYLVRSARQWRPHDPQRAMLASSFVFALVAYLTTAAFLHLSYQRYFWVLLGLANAVIWSLRREADEQLGTRRPGAASGSPA